MRFTLERNRTGLLIIDVQQKLFPLVEHSCGVLCKLCDIIKTFRILDLPVIVTEQYPKGLGETILPLKEILGECQNFFPKTAFSALKDEKIRQNIIERPVDYWILTGFEAHVCVLQTAKDLIQCDKKVAVLNDAISSRSIYDYSSAIAEMRDCGVRVTTTETVIFELVGDSKVSEFKEISQLIKCASDVGSCCCQ